VDSRATILAVLRAASAAQVPLPDLPAPGPAPADPVAAFSDALAAAGGTAVRVADAGALPAAVATLIEGLAARTVLVADPRAGRGNVDLEAVPEPRALAGLELAVLRGELGVAENGAVWVDTRPLRHRAAFVVAEHLALVIEATSILPDLHAAYGRLRLGGTPGLGLFIAGPSKTADIEQALVIGAHGARSCTVFVVG
jgi:L-lactate dehydrogenase complex protein LldG